MPGTAAARHQNLPFGLVGNSKPRPRLKLSWSRDCFAKISEWMPIEAWVHFYLFKRTCSKNFGHAAAFRAATGVWPITSTWPFKGILIPTWPFKGILIQKSDPEVHNVSSHTVWAQRSLGGFASSIPSSQPTLSSSALMAKALLTVGTNEARPTKTRSEHRSKCLDLSSRTFDVFLAPYAIQTVSGQTPIFCDMGE